uniref:B30.2/SPRY domain-containing protein n=1 Tax=Acanthochromis polyacanthus TaxID=80966 RepID=A0A3Q1FLG7_9TELE
MKDPVKIPCGHNYCMNCINLHWDEEDHKHIYSCPQCTQMFLPRPDLRIAQSVEAVKKTGDHSITADIDFARPGDVSCNFCTGRKLNAVKSCLQCLVSYCDQHLQPHYQSPAFKNHNLVDPSKKLHDNICSHHKEVMKIFCQVMKIFSSAERSEKQTALHAVFEKIQQRIQNREKDVEVLQQEVEAINQSADKAVRNIDRFSKDQTKVNRAKNLLQKLQEEITKLRRQDAELEQLSQTKDDCRFLHMFPLISGLSATKWPCPKPRHLQYFEDVTAALSQLYEKLQGFLCEELPKHSRTVTEVDVLLPKPEPTTREEFLQHSCQITLDPNTANMHMILSEENKKATYKRKKQAYPSHPERFMDRSQVLSREALTGRHYWEVEWDGLGIFVAVAYKDISRTGDDSKFGNNDKSWALLCSDGDYELTHKGHGISISAPLSSKVGVYLDYRAGILSFYSVSDSMTLIHRVQTTFTQPLYVGLRAYYFLNVGSSAVLC